MTNFHLLRQKSSQFSVQQAMTVKYANLPRHEGMNYHDPVTGILRSVNNYDAHAAIDVASDIAREEIKAFMRLANESVCSDKTLPAAERGSKAMIALSRRYGEYVQKRKTKADVEPRLFENILLAHMLNLFNANLLTAEETRKHLVRFREDI